MEQENNNFNENDNVQNINGEYYDKEDIENIYSLDFELI